MRPIGTSAVLRAANGPSAPVEPHERRLGRQRRRRLAAPDRVVQDDQAHAVAEERLDLDARHERGHAVEHVGRAEHPVAAGGHAPS